MMKKRFLSSLLAVYVVLGSWKGYLAIFEDGQEEPRQIFPLQVSALPPADQQALDDGMVIRSESRLEQLLEDYLS